MPLRRFYVPRHLIRNDTAVLPPDEAHHLRHVLRLSSGDEVEIFDGEGKGYVGHVQLRGAEVVVCRLQPLQLPTSQNTISLAVALIKPGRFEWILQKATELGVSEIIPLKTQRSEIRIGENKVGFRWQRWNRIIKEAAKQCRRFDAPRLQTPWEFSELLSRAEPCSCTKLLFDESAVNLWQPDKRLVNEKVIICIGPEGGWESEEVARARLAGFQVFSLGNLILRSETAAIAALAIVRYQLDLLRR